MAEYIIIGAEGKDINAPVSGDLEKSSRNRQGQGIYVFPWSGNEISRKEKPDVVLAAKTDEKTRKTPRLIKSIEGQLYVLTNTHLQAIPLPKVVQKNLVILLMDESRLPNVCENVASQNRFKKIINNANTSGWMEAIDHKGLFALFNYDSFKLNTTLMPESKENINPRDLCGYLFQFDTGTALPRLKQIQGAYPSGMFKAHQNTITMASGSSLEKLMRTEKNKKAKPASNYAMRGNILALDVLDQWTIASTNRAGFMVVEGANSIHDYERKAEFIYFRDCQKRRYLASEATAALLVRSQNSQNENYYALFGMDSGKIMVYRLCPDLKVEYCKTISFFSDDYMAGERDNHVWNLRSTQDWISFNVQNMYVRVGLNQFLDGHEQESYVPLNHMLQEKDRQNALARYKVDRLCLVPHTISTMEVVTL